MKKYFENFRITFRQVFDILLLVVLLIFIIQNLVSTEVKFLFFKFTMPLIVIIIVVFLIGFFTHRTFSKKKRPAEKESGHKDEQIPEA